MIGIKIFINIAGGKAINNIDISIALKYAYIEDNFNITYKA